MVGFTKLSSSMDARELVELLNDLFGQFDDLAKVSDMSLRLFVFTFISVYRTTIVYGLKSLETAIIVCRVSLTRFQITRIIVLI